MNLIEEKAENSLECASTGHSFLNRKPIVQSVRMTINKCSFMKLKSLFRKKNNIKMPKQQLKEWEKIFTNFTSDWGQIHKIYEELKIEHINKPNIPIKNGYRPRQIILIRKFWNVWETLKKMFNILSHWRKANQNYFVIPFYPCQNA